MAFCAFCGAQLTANARFCASCGAAVTQEPLSASVNSTISTTVYTGDGYAVMLVDTGSCALSAAANLISDTCGYTDAEAVNIVSSAPTWIAQSLNKSQAAYLAQCLTEYGMEAAIYDRNGNQAFISDVSSVFDNSGSLLTKVASALGLIGIGNRITGAIRRLTLPSRPPVYALRQPAPRPPVRRHTIVRQTPPPQQMTHPHMIRNDRKPELRQNNMPPHGKPEHDAHQGGRPQEHRPNDQKPGGGPHGVKADERHHRV